MNDPDSRTELCTVWACALEALSPKFGNVHVGHEFPSLKVRDFIRSAKAIAPVMGQARGRPIGETILEAIQETHKVVNTNTNLGIVLLLAPLATVENDAEFQSSVHYVLDHLTVNDAIKTYQAIRLAEPGGLGVVEQQDIRAEPTVTLREAMALAADRDLIARQYVNGFADVFAGTDWLGNQRTGPNDLNKRVVDLQLWFLSRDLDSLVLRKHGAVEAQELQRLANDVRESAKPQAALEKWFAAEFPHRNPGTTADLVCASLFVALRTGIIPLPEIPPEILKA